MQLHSLQRRTKRLKSQSVGRGGKRGKTSGRGTKGQKARSGRKIRPEIRDMIKRIPKLRGRGKNSFKSFVTKPTIVSLADLSTITGTETVTPALLISKGIVSKLHGKTPSFKIVSSGDAPKKISLSGFSFTAAAKEKIEKAGGTIEGRVAKK